MGRFAILLVFLLFSFSSGRNKFSSASISSCDTLTATDSILTAWLSSQVVENDLPQFKSLWTYVSVNELDSIEKSNQFLRTFDFKTRAQKEYFSALTSSKFDRHQVAGFLRASEKLRTRDAWTSYWPSIVEDQQGDQMVQVFLEDSALIVSFLPGNKAPFLVYDLHGTVIPESQLLKREKHIAAVFMYNSGKPFFREGDQKKNKHVHRRSFYLVNEKMIHHWQHATPAMQDGVLRDLQYLLLLEAWARENTSHTAKAGRRGEAVLKAWNASPQERTIPEKVFSCRRTTKEVDVDALFIREMITGIRHTWPLQVKTIVKFPSKGIR
jgi:hypothetical protein